MVKRRGVTLAVVGVFALGAGVALNAIFVCARAQNSPAAPAAQTAGEHFKNIQVLKDIPASELDPTMDFIADSLGVSCGYCHVRGDFSKDDKRPKLAARKMIAMELSIDKQNFGGRTVVTCYTCHRGLTHPVGAPVIGTASAREVAETTAAGTNASAKPTPDQILLKYLSAVGGAEAAGKITSREAKGNFSPGNGPSIPLDLFAKPPGKLLIVLRRPDGGANQMAYADGQSWGTNGRQARPLRGGILDVVRSQAQLAFPAGLKSSFANLRVGRPEKVGDQSAYVLYAAVPGQPPAKLYFDQQSGLLLRVECFNRTPLGMDPIAVDYSDYRDVDGVKVPYRWTIGAPRNRSTIQFSQIQQNVAIPDSKFAPPASIAPAASGRE